MLNWHSTRVSKYSGLLEIIKKNKWYADLFAVEVGAFGYSSTTLKYSFQKLGFSNTLIKHKTYYKIVRWNLYGVLILHLDA